MIFSRLTGPKKILAAAAVWLFVITGLHLGLNGELFSKKGPRHIRIGYLPITCHLLLPVALTRDSEFSQGVDAIKFSSWPDMIEAFKGGELDAAMILAPIAISLRSQGVPLRIPLLGHRNGTALVFAMDLREPRQLRGGTVAIPIRYSTQNLALKRFLELNRTPKDSIEVVELPPPDMPAALAAGAISAYIVGEPYAAQAELSESGHIYCEADAIYPNFISSLLILSEKFLTDRRRDADWVVRTLYEQGEWIEGHRRQAALIGARFYGLSDQLLLTVLTSSETRVRYKDLIPDGNELSAIASEMVRYGLADQRAIGLAADAIYLGWRR